MASLVVVTAVATCGQLLRPGLNRRSKLRKISLKEDLRDALSRRALSQQHEDAGLLGRRRDVPTRYFGPRTEVSRSQGGVMALPRTSKRPRQRSDGKNQGRF